MLAHWQTIKQKAKVSFAGKFQTIWNSRNVCGYRIPKSAEKVIKTNKKLCFYPYYNFLNELSIHLVNVFTPNPTTVTTTSIIPTSKVEIYGILHEPC